MWRGLRNFSQHPRPRRHTLCTMRWIALGTLVIATAASAGERCHALDGQTLQCGPERVLVEGLSAPALKHPEGEQARLRLQKRISAGELVIERRGFDQWGRTLGRVFVGGDRVTQLSVSPGAPKKTRHTRK
jgi:endonuclease YncB( thermonuclease family)